MEKFTKPHRCLPFWEVMVTRQAVWEWQTACLVTITSPAGA